MGVREREHVLDRDAVHPQFPRLAAVPAEVQAAVVHAGEDAAAARLDHQRTAVVAVERAPAIDPTRARTVAFEHADAADRADEQP